MEQVRGQSFVPVLGGGTAMVTAQQVADAAVGAIEYRTHRSSYAICGMNMKFKDFYQIIADVLGQSETQIAVLPLEQMNPAMEEADAHSTAAGKEHGIHLGYTAIIQDRDAYLNPEDTMTVLKFKETDIPAAMRETIAACV